MRAVLLLVALFALARAQNTVITLSGNSFSNAGLSGGILSVALNTLVEFTWSSGTHNESNSCSAANVTNGFKAPADGSVTSVTPTNNIYSAATAGTFYFKCMVHCESGMRFALIGTVPCVRSTLLPEVGSSSTSSTATATGTTATSTSAAAVSTSTRSTTAVASSTTRAVTTVAAAATAGAVSVIASVAIVFVAAFALLF